ncbi:hypothetical protein VSDG_00243 [Cytospora chrysosperma]|uniref:F-box domain-containing protein n=1 Tax=Cytospora chrysosperma TaxID=252740 RepID=A0A423WQ20_CYTCH|nr:hypothetical protein VSDG_00243 [Valsa sordida]
MTVSEIPTLDKLRREGRIEESPFDQLIFAESTTRALRIRSFNLEWDLRNCRNELASSQSKWQIGQLEDGIFPTDPAWGQGPPADPERLSRISAMEEELAGIKQRLEKIQKLHAEARTAHNAFVRAKSRPLNVLDLPDEILIAIFDFAKGRDESRLHFFFDDGYTDVATIKNVRLTCRRFNHTASHLLLAYVDVCLCPSSLAHLKEVSLHPVISRGISTLRIHASIYSSRLARFLGHFAQLATAKLADFADYHERLLGRMRAGEEERMSRYCTPVEVKKAAQQARRIISSWEQHWHADDHEIDSGAEGERWPSDVAALQRIHKVYAQRYEEQQSVMKDGLFIREVAAAMARMPRALRLYITDSQIQTYPDLGEFKSNFELADNPELFLRERMLDSIAWFTAMEDFTENPPTDLLFRLPLAIFAEGVSLVHLDIAVEPPRDLSITFNQEHHRDLRAACKHLRVFGFRGRGNPDEFWMAEANSEDSGEVQNLFSFLRAFLSSECIERLDLNLGFLDEAYEIPNVSAGSLLTFRTWPALQHMSLDSYPIHLDELQHFFRNIPLEARPFFNFKGLHLINGTWEKALDVIRERPKHWDSLIHDPRGGEIYDMPDEERKAIFEPKMGSKGEYIGPDTKATRYITLPFIKENPLRRGENVSELLDS